MIFRDFCVCPAATLTKARRLKKKKKKKVPSRPLRLDGDGARASLERVPEESSPSPSAKSRPRKLRDSSAVPIDLTAPREDELRKFGAPLRRAEPLVLSDLSQSKFLELRLRCCRPSHPPSCAGRGIARGSSPRGRRGPSEKRLSTGNSTRRRSLRKSSRKRRGGTRRPASLYLYEYEYAYAYIC